MDDEDLAAIPREFAAAARRCRDAGFDAVEVHLAHGYLLSQFLSPAINRRRDGYGGDLMGRMRLSLEVVEAVLEAVGDELAVVAKLQLSDGLGARGFQVDDAVAVARELERLGIAGIVPSGGLVSQTAFYLLRGRVPLSSMIEVEKSWLQRGALRLLGPLLVRPVPYTSSFFFDEALKVRDAVGVPVGLLGGVDSAAAARRALVAGFAFVVMGRGLLADPRFVPRIAAGEDVVSRCTHCNECVAEMDRGGVRCVLSVPG
jgi:2,4-dienoyl-CoA reductase-like NADH-dependent reductase (Old Yellow Enzyme family)